MFVGTVGGDHHRRALVAPADDLEQQVRDVLVDWKVTELIDDEYGGLQVPVEFALESAGGLGRCQVVDDVDCRREKSTVCPFRQAAWPRAIDKRVLPRPTLPIRTTFLWLR